MAGKISSMASGIQAHDGSRASVSISTNTRARTTAGFIGLATDTVVFAAGTGTWFMTNQRVRVNNVPTIGSSSIGISNLPPQMPPIGPMIVVQGDGRVDAM